MENQRFAGTVKWFNPTKGFGFITRPDGPDVFVHQSALPFGGDQTLAEGQQVEFEIEDGPKGPKAVHVSYL